MPSIDRIQRNGFIPPQDGGDVERSGQARASGEVMEVDAPVAADPGDRFEVQGDSLAPLTAADSPALGNRTSPISDKGRQVLERFQSQLEAKMDVSVREMFDPNLRTVEGAPFTRQLEGEDVLPLMRQMMMDLPLGDTAIGRSIAAAIQNSPLGFLAGDDLLSLSPNELTDEVGDAVKERMEAWLDQMKENKPALFYGAAGLAAVGVGALAYDQGSEALERLGIDSTIKASLFGGHLRVQGDIAFGPRFRDFRVENARVSAHGSKGNLSYSARVDLESDGSPESARVDARYRLPLTGGDQMDIWMGYSHDFETDADRLSGGMRGSIDDLDFSLDGRLDLDDGDYSVEASVGKRFGSGILEGYAAVEDDGTGADYQAGVRLKFRF